jgi:hypothetical protein
LVTPRILVLSALLLPRLVMAEPFEGLAEPGPILGTLDGVVLEGDQYFLLWPVKGVTLLRALEPLPHKPLPAQPPRVVIPRRTKNDFTSREERGYR